MLTYEHGIVLSDCNPTYLYHVNKSSIMISRRTNNHSEQRGRRKRLVMLNSEWWTQRGAIGWRQRIKPRRAYSERRDEEAAAPASGVQSAQATRCKKLIYRDKKSNALVNSSVGTRAWNTADRVSTPLAAAKLIHSAEVHAVRGWNQRYWNCTVKLEKIPNCFWCWTIK
jgi:hypothetical protein